MLIADQTRQRREKDVRRMGHAELGKERMHGKGDEGHRLKNTRKTRTFLR